MTALQTPSVYFIDVAKIRDYLLNRDHLIGKSKAVFFVGCGFSTSQPEQLVECLFAHAIADNLAQSVKSPFGIKWIFEGPIETPGGLVPGVRSVWIVRPTETVAELVTAYKF